MSEISEYSLKSALSIIADKYEQAESDLKEYPQVWDYLCINYNGNPLANLSELLSNDEDIKEILNEM